VSEIGDCRKKTRKQVPVTTRRPAFYFYGTQALALALALADPSRIAALSGEMAAEFNFSDVQGCRRWLAWLPLGAAPTSPCDGAPFRCKHGSCSATIRTHYRLFIRRLHSTYVVIALSRLHEDFGPLCCCPGSRPLTAGRLEPLYLWRTHQLSSSMKRHSMDVLPLHGAQSRIE
jgi:hypothetical protein